MKLDFKILTGVLAIIVIGCDRQPPKDMQSLGSVEPVHLSDTNFHIEVIESQVPVLVDMWAPWCHPCIAMKPTIRDVTEDLNGTAKVGELNIEENPFIKEKYNIDKYPMLLIFVDGKEVQRLVGMKTHDELVEAVVTSTVRHNAGVN
ncbi:thioredoxin family protein [Thalassoglobus polymorphus]|uniref:Thioredoxin-1 n=1 Tax=Thalassoglobus polymorphus TaxID=2527994 RepID=A0A517QJZ7_9PLAN|nr:thioredoxin domain-containing protein [Thalassoglobus polymorphus]QDT31963.1 Thioredoxin-1 [Thalassoglobus polymorphus]